MIYIIFICLYKYNSFHSNNYVYIMFLRVFFFTSKQYFVFFYVEKYTAV